MKPTGGWPWLNLQSLSSVMTPFHSGALAEVPSMPQPHLHGEEQGVTCHTLQHTTHRGSRVTGSCERRGVAYDVVVAEGCNVREPAVGHVECGGGHEALADLGIAVGVTHAELPPDDRVRGRVLGLGV